MTIQAPGGIMETGNLPEDVTNIKAGKRVIQKLEPMMM